LHSTDALDVDHGGPPEQEDLEEEGSKADWHTGPGSIAQDLKDGIAKRIDCTSSQGRREGSDEMASGTGEKKGVVGVR